MEIDAIVNRMEATSECVRIVGELYAAQLVGQNFITEENISPAVWEELEGYGYELTITEDGVDIKSTVK